MTVWQCCKKNSDNIFSHFDSWMDRQMERNVSTW